MCFAQTRSVTDAELQQIHRGMLLIDTHNDITSRTVDGYDIGKNAGDGHTNLPGLRAGDVHREELRAHSAGTQAGQVGVAIAGILADVVAIHRAAGDVVVRID